MSDPDLRPPQRAAPSPMGAPPPSTGSRWWEPLTNKWGFLALLIFLGLVLSGVERTFNLNLLSTPQKMETDTPSSRLSIEERAQQAFEQKKQRDEALRPQREKAAERRAAVQQQAKENSQAQDRVRDLQLRKLILDDFRSALAAGSTGKARQIVEASRAAYLARTDLVYKERLDAEERSLTRDWQAAAALNVSVEKADRAAAIEMVVAAFGNPNLSNQDITGAISRIKWN